tara:strand:- start:168 stop:1589 length:1422 start_codon:yes stop_codon:yes gene_type:complete
MGIQINGQTDRISAVDGTMTFPGTVTYEDVSRINVVGVVTATGLDVADTIVHNGDSDTNIRFPAADTFAVETAGNERLRIDSSGNMGLGVTPEAWHTGTKVLRIGAGGALHSQTVNRITELTTNTYHDGTDNRYIHSDFATQYYQYLGAHVWSRAASGTAGAAFTFQESMRIDSSGNMGLGISNPAAGASGGSNRILNIASGTSSGVSHITFGDSNAVGKIESVNGNGTIAINATTAVTIGTSGSSEERMRIGSNGYLYFGNQTAVNPAAGATSGLTIRPDPLINMAANSNSCLTIGRNVNDGALVVFYQAGTVEGNISVSGSTVTLNGAHLSRWSQLPSGAERAEILRGTVLSNLDEMCEWGDEDNEQLNRMKVSDVEGDRNVSGVFQSWDDDDDTYTNDFYCAMTGDFVIRIAQGTTVVRGDLLMSAGDGTAKPQDDDIVRSKTIAKVTSTTVSETYSDGSYCVPCVLMAC